MAGPYVARRDCHEDRGTFGGKGRSRRFKMAGRPKGGLGRVCLVLLGVLGGVLLCEVIAKTLLSVPLYGFDRGLFVEDETVGYRLRRSWTGRHSQPEYCYVIRTNSWGWRGPEPNLGVARRVLAIGDSVAFGQGVGDGKHICDLARVHLAEQVGDVDLLNASAPGYCLVNEVALLRELLREYQPLLVVHVFCVNDFGVKKSLRAADGFLLLHDHKRVCGALRSWLNQRSHVFCLLRKAYYVRFAPEPDYSLDVVGSYRESDLDFVEEKLTEMGRLCRGAGAKFVVFISPGPGTLGAPKGWLEPLLACLSERSIAYLSPGAAMCHEELETLVFPYDRHYNEAGCKVVSRSFVGLVERELKAIGVAGRREMPQDRQDSSDDAL